MLREPFNKHTRFRHIIAHLPMLPWCMASMVPTDSVQYEVGGSHSTAWHFLTVKTYLHAWQQILTKAELATKDFSAQSAHMMDNAMTAFCCQTSDVERHL